MFKKFIHWFFGVEFWKTASTPKRIAVGVISAFQLSWIAYMFYDAWETDRLIQSYPGTSEPETSDQ